VSEPAAENREFLNMGTACPHNVTDIPQNKFPVSGITYKRMIERWKEHLDNHVFPKEDTNVVESNNANIVS